MKFLYVLGILTLLYNNDCNISYPPPSHVHPTPVVVDSDWCQRAQDNLIKLNCAEGQPTKKGKSFNDLCKEKQDNGLFLNPKCLSSITACSMVDSCTNSRLGE